MEASREAVGLVPLSDQPQFSGVFCVFGAHVLDVDLRRRGGDVDAGGEKSGRTLLRVRPPA